MAVVVITSSRAKIEYNGSDSSNNTINKGRQLIIQ